MERWRAIGGDFSANRNFSNVKPLRAREPLYSRGFSIFVPFGQSGLNLPSPSFRFFITFV